MTMGHWQFPSPLASSASPVPSTSFHTNLRMAADGGLLAVAPRSAVSGVAAVLGLKTLHVAWDDQESEIVLASLKNPGLVVLQTCF